MGDTVARVHLRINAGYTVNSSDRAVLIGLQINELKSSMLHQQLDIHVLREI